MVVTNPNNWHWVDKNCIDWTRKYFDEKLTGFKVTSGDVTVGIKQVSSIEGDVDVCQRKGKVISLFDINMTLNMSGEDTKSGETMDGSIVVPELTYSSERDDIQYETSIYDTTNKKDEIFKPVIRKLLLPKLTEILIQFGKDLMITHGSDIQVSLDKVESTFTKGNQNNNIKGENLSYKIEQKTTVIDNSKYNTSTLHLEPIFNTTAEQIYITLLDKTRITAWSRSLPIIEQFPPSEGSDFKFFGGSVSGKILKLVTNEQIVQLWRLEDWKSGHYAELDMKLVQGTSDTKLVVKFTGIPIGEEDRVKNNFEDYYIRSIKITFGFGAVL